MEVTVVFDGRYSRGEATETPDPDMSAEAFAAAFAEAHDVPGADFYLEDESGPLVDDLSALDGRRVTLRAGTPAEPTPVSDLLGETPAWPHGPVELEGPIDGTVEATLAWVDADDDLQLERAKTALLAESTREKPRKGIVEPLEALIAAYAANAPVE